MIRRRKTNPFIGLLFLISLSGGPLYVDGTYDLDEDSLSELLLFYDEKEGGKIQYIEIEENGSHTLLWSFMPAEDILGHISSVKMVDLDNDNVPEIIAILRTELRNKNNNDPWLLLFKWEGQTFSSVPIKLYEDDLSFGRTRPSNFVVLNNDDMTTALGVAFSTPSRTGGIFNLNLIDNRIHLTDFRLIESSVIGNGYGRVFIGSFEHKEKNKIVLFTLEANLIKISLYNVQDGSSPLQEIYSDVFSLNGVRQFFAPGIVTIDEDMNGNEELLLPFLNGEVVTLSIDSGKMILKPSSFSKKPLFFLNKGVSEKEINSFVLARIEDGLYRSSLVPKTIEMLTEKAEESLVLESDSLILPTAVVSLDPKISTVADAVGETHPVVGTAIIEEQDLRTNLRKTAKEEDSIEQSSFSDYYSISIAIEKEKEALHFSSNGDNVFSVKIDTSLEKIAIHRISLDMEKMTGRNKANFEYKIERSADGPVTRISLTHDLKTNMLLVSKSPVSSAIPQSFNPEVLDSRLHKYPEYLFDGFPTTISMESFDGGIQFKIEEEVEITEHVPFIEMVSPSDPPQKFKMYFKSGNFQSIKSVVRVRKSGSRKTVSRIEFIGEANPIVIQVSLGELPRQ